MRRIRIDLQGREIEQLQEITRQQLLGDCEAIVDSLHGRECVKVGMEASERVLFSSRLIRRLEVSTQ